MGAGVPLHRPDGVELGQLAGGAAGRLEGLFQTGRGLLRLVRRK